MFCAAPYKAASVAGGNSRGNNGLRHLAPKELGLLRHSICRVTLERKEAFLLALSLYMMLKLMRTKMVQLSVVRPWRSDSLVMNGKFTPE